VLSKKVHVLVFYPLLTGFIVFTNYNINIVGLDYRIFLF